MEILICTTDEWQDCYWKSYTNNFNRVFHLDNTIEYFKVKYTSTCTGFCYHALLLDEKNEVTGGCTVMPVNYKNADDSFLNGIGMDVFIVEESRTDPLLLRRMYKKLVARLKSDGVEAVTAVPNATAYPYWKNVVKWKDVGDINYWVFPVNVGNVLGKYKFLNYISVLYKVVVLPLSKFLSLCRVSQPHYRYELNIDDDFLSNRFKGDYINIKESGFHNIYRIVDEDGVRTAYLIYSVEGDRMTLKSLYRGVKLILMHNKIDLILFVGKIGFTQSLFMKIPRRFEPKRLPLTCDLLNNDSERYPDIHDIRNWDFGLINYDVR